MDVPITILLIAAAIGVTAFFCTDKGLSCCYGTGMVIIGATLVGLAFMALVIGFTCTASLFTQAP